MPEPHLRAGDTDRAAVATVLGRHMSAGRLTMEEYDERLARAYAAKTYGELDELTVDLPPVAAEPAASGATAPARVPVPATTPWGHGWSGNWDDPHSWRSWLSTALIVLAIWTATSLAAWEVLYFWPAWVIGPWGAVLLARTLTAGRDDDREKRRQLG